jgi:hypothetical protein
MYLCTKDVPHASERPSLASCIHFNHSEGDEADHSQLQYAAAKYYRLAEQGGSKTLGNSW